MENSSSGFGGLQLPSLSFLQSPLSFLLEYSGILPARSSPHHHHDDSRSSSASTGEVSIRIIEGERESEYEVGEAIGESIASEVETPPPNGSGSESLEDGNGITTDSSYQRYDIQQVARWIEQILPFSLLLLLVFIRQHLQGVFITIWISAVMFKSNDIVQKQTALKGERKNSVLIGISIFFILHVIGVYWWYQNDDLLYPLFMLPPKAILPFWHAVFIILVNDTMVRQAAMAFKCLLLMYYKNGSGHNFRRQVQSFFAAFKALSRKEVHYGSYATSEQVNAAGDLCAICQEKMHAPIQLRCKHIFCEDCVSEWFERERTCPLCRALIKPADLRTFGDGSTSLFFQLF